MPADQVTRQVHAIQTQVADRRLQEADLFAIVAEAARRQIPRVVLVRCFAPGNLAIFGSHPEVSVILADCVVAGGFYIDGSRLRSLEVRGTTVRGPVVARSAKFTDDVRVLDNSRLCAGLNLSLARIDGALACMDSFFGANPDGLAINGDRTRVGGMAAVGRSIVRGSLLLSASDLGELSLEGTSVVADGGSHAISAEGAVVRGMIDLRAVHAVGQVELSTVTTRRAVEFDGSHVVNPGGTAVRMQGARIGGNLFFRDGFQSFGLLNLGDAHVTGRLEIIGSTVRGSRATRTQESEPPPHVSVLCRGMTADGGATIGVGGHLDGLVDFGEATVRQLTIGGRITVPVAATALYADRLTSERVEFTEGVEVVGQTSLNHCEIDQLRIAGATIRGTPASIALEKTTVGTLVVRDNELTGAVNLTAADVEALSVDDESLEYFADRYLLEEFRFDRIVESTTSPLSLSAYVAFLRSDRREDRSYAPWRSLHAFLRGRSRVADAATVMLEAHRRNQPLWVRSTFGLLLGFGYRLRRLAAAAVLLVTVGSLVGLAGESAGVLVHECEFRSLECDAEYSFRSAAFGIDTAIPILEIPYARDWHDTGTDRLFTGVTLSVRVLGWALVTVAAAGLARFGRRYES